MFKRSIYFFLLLSFTLLGACSGKDAAGTKDDEQVNSQINQNDSLTSDSVSEGQNSAASEGNEVDQAKSLGLTTTEKQLAYMRGSSSSQKYESGILPQMAEDAPSYCQKILESNGKRFIVVDKAKMKLFLYDPYGNVEKSYGIACAKNFGTKHKKGDSRTTEGIVEVKSIHDSSNWLFTNDAGYTSPTRGVYGPKFIRLTIPYIGIHGTGSPSSIGKRCSHGCIRVTNDNILELVKYVEEGMPVIISPGPADMAVNEKEGYKVLAVATEPGTPKAVPGKYVPVHFSSESKNTTNNSDAKTEQNASVNNEQNQEEPATAPTTVPANETKSEQEVKHAPESSNENSAAPAAE